MDLIRLKDVKKTYKSGTTAIYDMDLNIEKGEFVVIVSPYVDICDNSELSIVDNVNLYIENGMQVMEAIKLVAKERKIAKNVVYSEYHRRNL